MNKTGISIIIIIIIALAITGFYSWLPKAEAPSMERVENGIMDTTKAGSSMTDIGGSYIPYSTNKLSFADNGKVVLFFKASWCPTCRILDADIKSHLGDIPDNIVILDVDYDNSSDLKQKYGVTYQHTLAQVDSKGELLVKWAGSPTLSDVVAKTI